MTAPFEWLNYHHLLYFWLTAREGGLGPAAERLRLSPPTLSAQIHALEDALGEKLFQKDGRRLALTEMGRVVYRYAEEIFSLGRELQDTVKGRPTGRPMKFTVGVDDAVPKMIVRLLLSPAETLTPPVQLVCREAHPERLVVDLLSHSLDAVLSDAPAPSRSGQRVFSHVLGECGMTVFGAPALAKRYREGFPRSLDGAPFLIPTEGATSRRALDAWFGELEVRPEIVGEFDDSALMKAFGHGGSGLFAAASVLGDEIERQYGVRPLGPAGSIRARFYLITAERKLKHPAVVAISEAAKDDVFGDGQVLSERHPRAKRSDVARDRKRRKPA